MHLRVSDLLCDLRLGHIVDEAKAQDESLALAQRRYPLRDRRPVLDAIEALFLGADAMKPAAPSQDSSH